jgi:hypothetical protein
MQRDLTHAWYVAMLSRQERVPSLEKLLAPLTMKSAQERRDEQRRAIEAFALQYRLKIREKVH